MSFLVGIKWVWCVSSGVMYLFTPQGIVVCAFGKQKVLQQPEESHQTGAERQRHTLGVPQVR